MTADELAQLRALCDAATPGPWKAVKRKYGDEVVFDGDRHLASPDQYGNPNRVVGLRNDVQHQNDAAFIAAARTALPRLIDEVERLKREAALVELVRVTEEVHGYCPVDEWKAKCARYEIVIAAVKRWRAFVKPLPFVKAQIEQVTDLFYAVDALLAAEAAQAEARE